MCSCMWPCAWRDRVVAAIAVFSVSPIASSVPVVMVEMLVLATVVEVVVVVAVVIVVTATGFHDTLDERKIWSEGCNKKF